MDQLPTPSFQIPEGAFSFLEGANFSIPTTFFQVLFFFTLIVALIYTAILFGHWKKYAPNPLKVFMYGVAYTIGLAIFFIAQLSLLALY